MDFILENAQNAKYCYKKWGNRCDRSENHYHRPETMRSKRNQTQTTMTENVKELRDEE